MNIHCPTLNVEKGKKYQKEYMKKYVEEHKDEIKEYMKKYRAEYDKTYYQANKERYLAKKKLVMYVVNFILIQPITIKQDFTTML